MAVFVVTFCAVLLVRCHDLTYSVTHDYTIYRGKRQAYPPICLEPLLFFAVFLTIASVAAVVLSSDSYSKKFMWFWLLSSFLMLVILLLPPTVQMSRVVRFALEEGSRCGWPNIRRGLVIIKEYSLLILPIVEVVVRVPYLGVYLFLTVLVLDMERWLPIIVECSLLVLHPARVLFTVVYLRVHLFLNVLCPGYSRREWYVPGSLKGIHVSAIPDTGSDLDIVSADFVQRHGITIDSKPQRYIQLPNGKTISIGTVSLPFLFEGEKSTFKRVFTVMPNCLHDVILSNSFLRTTETLTKFSRRLKNKFVPSLHTSRLRLLGAPSSVFGARSTAAR